jgi:hypothetical protein
MRVVVATSEGQGRWPDDYCWTVEGELVLVGPALECDCPECGCDRGFPGLASCRATTTAKVVDWHGLEPDDLRAAIRDSLARQGWLAGLDETEVEAVVDDEQALVRRVALSFPPGTVVCRNGTTVWAREMRRA